MKRTGKDIPNFKNMTEEQKKEWEKKLDTFHGLNSKAHMVKTIDQLKGWIF